VATPDHFETFELPRSWELDRADLERRYLELSRAVHPDRFIDATGADRRVAMERAAAVNEGYRTLRDPVRRAEYLCLLGGIDLDSSDPEHGAPKMDATFLGSMIENREELMDRRARGAAAVERMREDVEAGVAEELKRAVEHLRGGDVTAAARRLVARRYLQRLLDEIDSG
jgi:molecular chaperone HscB